MDDVGWCQRVRVFVQTSPNETRATTFSLHLSLPCRFPGRAVPFYLELFMKCSKCCYPAALKDDVASAEEEEVDEKVVEAKAARDEQIKEYRRRAALYVRSPNCMFRNPLTETAASTTRRTAFAFTDEE